MHRVTHIVKISAHFYNPLDRATKIDPPAEALLRIEQPDHCKTELTYHYVWGYKTSVCPRELLNLHHIHWGRIVYIVDCPYMLSTSPHAPHCKTTTYHAGTKTRFPHSHHREFSGSREQCNRSYTALYQVS
jgi:hypothetical protein